MDHNREGPRFPLHGYSLSLAAEDLHEIRENQLLGYAGRGIVIATDDECLDACLGKPPKLLGQKTCRLHGRLIAVIEIASQKKGVYPLFKAQINDAHKSAPRGIADQRGQIRIAQSE